MSQQSTLDFLLDALDDVEVFKVKVFRATSPAQLAAEQARLARITDEIAKRFPEVNNDLISEFHKSFVESGGSGNIPKNWVDKAYRTRQKAAKGYEKATTGLRQWGNDFGRTRQIIGAREAYKAKLARLQKTGGSPADIADVEEQLKKLKGVGKEVSDVPSVFYHRRLPNGDIRRVEVPATVYMKMATDSAYSIQRNLGRLAAFSKNSEWVIVLDGPECGKSQHSGGDPVNGQIWQIAEALQHPISHPSCQRTFIQSDGPPGSKKSKDQRKRLNQAGQERSRRFKNLETIAKVAGATGLAVSTGATIVQNPFVRRFMREIISDTNIKLSPLAQRVLTRLGTYSTREARAFAEHGATLGAGTQQQFDDLVAKSFDDDLANDVFLNKRSIDTIPISQAQARVLGLSTRPTKGELLSRLDDYGDYLLHKESITKAIDERILTAANFSSANEELYRTAALKFHIDPAEGLNLHRNWYNTIHKLKDTYKLNPDKADRDLVRLAAGVLDPTPWLRVNLAPGVKFTLGMTSRGRQNLAVKLYDKLKQGRLLSDTEVRWAEELGMDMKKFTMPETIGIDDIVKAFQPRITYQPGGLFSATLALKNGKLQPIIRLYPKGSFGRLVSLESKLRTGAIEDFIAAMRKHDLPLKDRWVDAFGNLLSEDLITSVNLFRNSPLQLSLRMIGATPDSWAIRALPDNDFLRYSYRFTLDLKQRTALQSEVRRRLLGGESVEDILKDMTKGPTKDLTEFAERKKNAQEVIRKEAARIAKADLDHWLEGVTVLPNLGGGFTLNGISIMQKEALIKLKLLGNNLIVIAKRTHYGYDHLLELWKDSKKVVDDILEQLKEKDIAKIRSFKDATNLLSDAMRKKTSLIDETIGENLERVDLSFASPAALKNPALRADLARFRLAWERQFPNGPLPDVKIVTNLATPLASEPGVILIRQDIADDWEVLGKLRRKAVRIGHFPADTEASVNNLIHEAAHSVLLQMDKKSIEFLLRRAMVSQKWPGNIGSFSNADLEIIAARLRSEPFKRRVARTVSGYGSTSIDELLAEAITEFFGSGAPRPIAKAVGDNFTLLVSPRRTKVAGYGWETKSISEIMKISEDKHDIHWGKIKAAEDALFTNGKVGDPGHTPMWEWFENAPPGLEDLEFDSKLLAEPLFIDDMQSGLLRIKKYFPDSKLPRVGYHPTQVSTPHAPMNGANMYYKFIDKNIYMTQHNLENYVEGRELRALGERLGWTPKGTTPTDNVIVHEMGHVLAGRLTERQFVEVIDFIRQSDIIGNVSRKQFDKIFEGFDLSLLDNNGDNNSHELQTEVYIQMDSYLKRDVRVRDRLSQYGSTNLHELIAEAFLNGIHQLELGNFGDDTAKLVKLFQKFFK